VTGRTVLNGSANMHSLAIANVADGIRRKIGLPIYRYTVDRPCVSEVTVFQRLRTAPTGYRKYPHQQQTGNHQTVYLVERLHSDEFQQRYPLTYAIKIPDSRDL